MAAVVLLLHLAFSAATGAALLRLRGGLREGASTLVVAPLLGLYVESLGISLLQLAGFALEAAIAVWAVPAVALIAWSAWRRPLRLPRLRVPALRWYEWACALLLAEIALFGVWQLVAVPAFFWDTMTHWSGRARAMYGAVNWSVAPDSPLFLGAHFGHAHYPLGLVTWRAVTAELCGAWNDLIARFDSLVFWALAVGGVWVAVRGFARARWQPAGAALLVGLQPLHGWHVAAGYADIAVEAYAIAAVLLLVRGEWLWGGVMTAGIAWSKNEGLALWVPAMLLAVLVARPGWRSIGSWTLGALTLAPWLVLKAVWGLGVAPNREGFQWQPGALGMFAERVLLGPTHFVFWPAVLLVVGVCAGAMARDGTGRALLVLLAAVLAGTVVVFCATGAFVFLQNEMTVHRAMMQVAGVAVVVMMYGVALRTRGEGRYVTAQAERTTR